MRALYKPLLSLISLVLVLGLAEGSLRLFDFEYSPLEIQITKPGEDMATTDWRDQHAFEDSHFRYHPDLLWVPRPGRSVFNSQGFRGKEIPDEKPADAYYVFTIGDSNTLCNAGGSHWPGYLDQRLRKQHPDVRVVNAGVWGYGAYQGVARLKQILKLKPDLVTISFGANDAHRVLIPDKDFAARKESLESPLFDWRLYQLLLWARDRSNSADDSEVELEDTLARVSLGDYEAHLNEIVDICEQHGIEVAFLTRPFKGKPHKASSWKNWGPAYNELTRKVARERGVPLFDVYERFSRQPDFFTGESHFNDDGNRRMAKLSEDFLEQNFELPD